MEIKDIINKYFIYIYNVIITDNGKRTDLKYDNVYLELLTKILDKHRYKIINNTKDIVKNMDLLLIDLLTDINLEIIITDSYKKLVRKTIRDCKKHLSITMGLI